MSDEPCECFRDPYHFLKNEQFLGSDEHFAEVSLLVCPVCGQHWLRYFYEVEAFTASGRWYLGAIPAEQAAQLVPEQAKAALEALDGYFYGGSYFDGQIGKTSGKIFLIP